MSLAAVLTMIYGLKQIAEHGIDALPVALIAVGVITAALFLRRQLTLRDPLIDVRLFRVPAFSASLATYMMGGIVMLGSFVFIAQYLQLVRGLSPLEAGLWMMPFAGSFVVGSMLTPLLAQRFNRVAVLACGLLVGAAGFAMLSQVGASTSLGFLVASFIVISLGLAPVFTLTTDMIMGTAPPERAGAASAISETSAEFGGALGIATLGSLGVAIYRDGMADSIPQGVSPETAETARSTLGGAVAAANDLPAALGDQLLFAARDAFTHSMETVAIISVALVTLTAIVVTVLLRNVELGNTSHEGEAVQINAPVDLHMAAVPGEAG